MEINKTSMTQFIYSETEDSGNGRSNNQPALKRSGLPSPPEFSRHFKMFIVAAGLLVAQSCGQKQDEKVESAVVTSDNLITLTASQFKAADISTGKIERKPMGTTLQVNGMLDVPPQNLITISAPMGGFVKSTRLLQGMKLKKGEIVATLENQEYIQLQQDYLDNVSKLEFAEAEYNRQQELAKENVNALKALQQAKSNYQSTKAQVKGLEAKLAMINISLSALAEGNIQPTINIYSPIQGYVTVVNVNIGQYVNATDVMFKIVNIEHLHAELQVYEKDINKITVGQKVSFQLANENDTRTASVYLIGKEISPERTVRIHCHLDKEDEHLLPGMYVTATIETTMLETDVVPAASIINFEGEDFVFAATSTNNQFEMIKVKTGNANAEYTEVQLPQGFDKNKLIIINGAFELLGILKNTQDE
jgi:cobalt-zinc-cadmium efflux system membrane fusion protein